MHTYTRCNYCTYRQHAPDENGGRGVFWTSCPDNNSYWGLELVCEAMKTARSAKVKARIEEDAEQAEIHVSEEKDEE